MFLVSPKHKLFFAVALGLLVCVGVAVYFSLHAQQAEIMMSTPERATMTGTYLCLESRENGAEEECVPGIQTESGEQYAIDFNLMSQQKPELSLGQRITASGVVTPIAALSTDYWQQYEVDGIFSVTDSVEVENVPSQDAEEENLFGTAWAWQRTEYLNKEPFAVPEPGIFVLSFNEDGTLTSTTDCNTMSGSFVKDGEVLSFGPLAMTKMFCADSVESAYAAGLALTSSYVITGDELRLNLSRDYGVMFFNRVSE